MGDNPRAARLQLCGFDMRSNVLLIACLALATALDDIVPEHESSIPATTENFQGRRDSIMTDQQEKAPTSNLAAMRQNAAAKTETKASNLAAQKAGWWSHRWRPSINEIKKTAKMRKKRVFKKIKKKEKKRKKRKKPETPASNLAAQKARWWFHRWRPSINEIKKTAKMRKKRVFKKIKKKEKKRKKRKKPE